MVILVIGWASFGLADMVEAFIKTGFEVDFFDYPFQIQDPRYNPAMGEKLIKKIVTRTYEFVFSTNYFPQVALSCNACKVKYLSWTYDSPYMQIYSNTAKFPYTYTFTFDQAMCRDMQKKGFHHTSYLPMAAAVERYDSYIPTQEDYEKYSADIVFVGSTYSENRHNWYKHLDGIHEYTKGYLEGLIQAQKKVYGEIFMDKCLTDDILKDLQRVQPSPKYPDDTQTPEWFYSRYVLARRVTAVERQEVLKLLSEKHQVHLYTHESTPQLPDVVNKGEADTYKEAMLIYKCAKINLNITLRSIETGIPLRVMDIMGCGGFVLTNYQADIMEHFEPGVDLAYYEDYDDLVRKVDYYLEHEEERKQIAHNGYEKVKRFHRYENRIEEMIDFVCHNPPIDEEM